MRWKDCEFCTEFKPVVYCKADAANLCLSCDAKVHSANALSSRHLRTLLCDSCRYRPCTIHCLEHGMFVCHGCDCNLHGVSSQHQRRVVSCYTGCPSAKDFAVMWGFQVNDDATLERPYDPVTSNSSGELQRGAGFILEQILELEKLQLSEGNGGLLLAEQADPSSTFVSNVSEDLDKNSSDILRQSEECLSDLPQLEKQELVDFSPSPFPQMEHLSSSSTVDNSFWQYKGPSKSYQLWYQNLQDIGVCEDTECRDDFDMPDIDLTFRNFEELFGADQEPNTGLGDNKTISVSSLEIMRSSRCKSDNRNARATEDASTASSLNSDLSARTKRGLFSFNGSRESTENTLEFLPAVKPALSLPASRFSRTECHQNQSEEVSCCSSLSDNALLGGRQNAISRLKEKKKARTEEKQTHCVPGTARREARKRTSGRFALTEGCSSDTVGTTRSY